MKAAISAGEDEPSVEAPLVHPEICPQLLVAFTIFIEALAVV